MAEQNAQANQNVADVPANEVERILGQAPQESQSAFGQGGSLLGAAGQLTRNTSTSGSQMGYGFSGDDAAALLAAL